MKKCEKCEKLPVEINEVRIEINTSKYFLPESIRINFLKNHIQ